MSPMPHPLAFLVGLLGILVVLAVRNEVAAKEPKAPRARAREK